MTTQQSVWADAWLESAYKRLEATPGFVPREQQVTLSQQLVRAFLHDNHLLAEAPTGTGKTLAYLLGALAAQHTREHFELPTRALLISTATIALQQQLMTKDLPWLAKVGLVRMSDVVLAKGRGNFVCLRSAEAVLEKAKELQLNPEVGYIDDEYDYSDPGPLENIVHDLQSGRWDGDLTRYPTRPTIPLRQIVVQSSTCVRQKCHHYRNCGYIAMRKALPTAKLLIVNHDLLLANWAAFAKGLETSLQFPQMDIVFDEGHHVPHKAVSAGSSTLALTRMGKHLPTSLQILEELAAETSTVATAAPPGSLPLWTAGVEVALQEALTISDALAQEPGETLRMRGRLPEDLASVLTALHLELTSLRSRVGGLSSAAAEKQSDGALPAEEQGKAAELTRRSVPVLEVLAQAVHCLSTFNVDVGSVRWIEVAEDMALTFHASPLQAKDVLNQWLWDSEQNVNCAFVSATLRDNNGFEFIKAETGIPSSAEELVLPPAFDYSKSTLTVARMTASPKPAEREQFRSDLKAALLRHVKPTEGTLLIFTSWALLKELTPWLTETYGSHGLLVQGERPVAALIEEHKRRIDRKHGNILAGVATLAEGLDLPGDYCVHVGIVALPFAVPTTPVEQELNDMLGPRYFAERSLPAATVRLVQMTGRLVRRESDRGRITVFDHRLASTRYGKAMLKALPPFNYLVEQASA